MGRRVGCWLEGPGRVQPARTSEPWKQHRSRASRGFASPSESPRAARGCGGPGRGLCEGCWWPRLPEAQVGSVGGEARVLGQEGRPPPHFRRCGRGVSRGPTVSTSLEFRVGWEWPRVASVLVYAALNARAAGPSSRVFRSAPPRQAALLRDTRTHWLSGATRLSPGSWGTGVGERAGGTRLRGAGVPRSQSGLGRREGSGALEGLMSARAPRLDPLCLSFPV